MALLYLVYMFSAINAADLSPGRSFHFKQPVIMGLALQTEDVLSGPVAVRAGNLMENTYGLVLKCVRSRRAINRKDRPFAVKIKCLQRLLT
jgi:hypothetical protein